MAENVAPWTAAQLEAVSKKDLLIFLQKEGSNAFLKQHKIAGKPVNVLKQTGKPKLDEAYNDLYQSKSFRTAADDEELTQKTTETPSPQATTVASTEATPEKPVEKEQVRYTKFVSKKGDKQTFPQKGDTVTVRFKGTCKSTGKVFQDITGKNQKPFDFKVGLGKVIKGWDEAMLTMSKGEKATVTIEPEWAYGKKGLPAGDIGPNETLIFEIELVNVY